MKIIKIKGSHVIIIYSRIGLLGLKADFYVNVLLQRAYLCFLNDQSVVESLAEAVNEVHEWIRWLVQNAK